MQYAVSEIVCRLCMALGLIGFALLGWMKAASWARAALGVSLLVIVCFKVACVGSHLAHRNWLPAFGYFVDVPTTCALCLGVWNEKRFVKIFGVAAVLDACFFVAQVWCVCLSVVEVKKPLSWTCLLFL